MKIIYFGPISPKNTISSGGFESINRKIIDKLVQFNVDVIEIPNPRIRRVVFGLGKILYILMFIRPLVLLKFKNQNDVIVHITPIDRSLLYPAAYTVFIARFLNIPILLDLHAGSFFYYYDRKGLVYKKLTRFIIQSASAITIEGKAYRKQLLERIKYDGEIMYFPNTAVCNNYSHIIMKDGKYNVFYFGRITNAKGVDIMLQLSDILDDRFHMYLDGAISDGLDLEKIDSNKVTYLGRHKMNDIYKIMEKMTFFIFPSRHIGEGQSNSLIEAMEAGLIPISSNQGFSEDVVADCGAIVPVDAPVEKYKEEILKLCSMDLQLLSRRCQEHIRKNHNVDVEIPRLIQLYNKIIMRQI